MPNDMTPTDSGRYSPKQLGLTLKMVANGADLSASERYELHEAAKVLRLQAARIAQLEATPSLESAIACVEAVQRWDVVGDYEGGSHISPQVEGNFLERDEVLEALSALTAPRS